MDSDLDLEISNIWIEYLSLWKKKKLAKKQKPFGYCRFFLYSSTYHSLTARWRCNTALITSNGNKKNGKKGYDDKCALLILLTSSFPLSHSFPVLPLIFTSLTSSSFLSGDTPSLLTPSVIRGPHTPAFPPSSVRFFHPPIHLRLSASVAVRAGVSAGRH